jgi:toxin ParE1/3/4
MTAKPIVPRERALGDIEAAIDYYAGEAGEHVALGFIDALESAFRLIAARPASGSLFYANALGLNGLRRWRLKRYPYLIFYLERDDHIDVWRVLHAQRDIPARLREPDD